jgi:hypothetical protein
VTSSQSTANNHAQRTSQSYLLAVEDKAFLLSDEMRPLRFAMEYGKAEAALRKASVWSTIVVFGSARIRSPEQAEILKRAATSGPRIERLLKLGVYHDRAPGIRPHCLLARRRVAGSARLRRERHRHRRLAGAVPRDAEPAAT